MRLKFNIDTKLYFLVGDPMDHSCTGLVNNGMFEFINQNAVLYPVIIPKGKLGEFIEAAKLLGASGFYLTMPHKEDILDHLDEVDELSAAFRSANHVRIDGDRLIGIGLDGVGMGETVQRSVGDLRGKYAVLVGAGSVAGAIAADLCKRGVTKLAIANRTLAKADSIKSVLGRYYPDVQVSTGTLDDDFLSAAAIGADAVVQCTSLGMNAPEHEDFASLAFMDNLPGHCFAADVLYPDSSFLAKARERGLRCENGVMMTIYQQKGIMKFQFGVDIPDEALLDAEENFRAAIAIRDLRFERLQKEGKA